MLHVDLKPPQLEPSGEQGRLLVSTHLLRVWYPGMLPPSHIRGLPFHLCLGYLPTFWPLPTYAGALLSLSLLAGVLRKKISSDCKKKTKQAQPQHILPTAAQTDPTRPWHEFWPNSNPSVFYIKYTTHRSHEWDCRSPEMGEKGYAWIESPPNVRSQAMGNL